jgi:hypothetical protein
MAFVNLIAMDMRVRMNVGVAIVFMHVTMRDQIVVASAPDS